MNPALDIAAEICRFLDNEIRPIADQMDERQEFPSHLITAAGATGLWGMCIPADYAGIDLGAHQFSHVCQAAGQASASMLSLITVHSMVSAAITRWGSEQQKQLWLPAMASGERIAAFALSEPEVGSDVTNVQTTFTKRGDELVINGKKKWISAAQVADLFLVSGDMEGKLVVVMVDRSAIGLEVQPIEGMLGFRAAMLGEVNFSNCYVPADCVLGSTSMGLSLLVGSVLDLGRHAIACGSVGVAQACVELSMQYAASRHVQGQPLNQLQLIQKMLTDMAVETRAAKLMCQDAATARQNLDPNMIVKSMSAKYFASLVAKKAADNTVQILGAYGCSAESSAQRLLRDAKIMEIIEGSTQIQQSIIAGYGEHWVVQSGAENE